MDFVENALIIIMYMYVGRGPGLASSRKCVVDLYCLPAGLGCMCVCVCVGGDLCTVRSILYGQHT